MARSSKFLLAVCAAAVLVGAIALLLYTNYAGEQAALTKSARILRGVAVDFVNKNGVWPLNAEDLKAFVREEAEAGSWLYQGSAWDWWFERLDRYGVTWTYTKQHDGSVQIKVTFQGTGPFGWFSQQQDVIIPPDQLEGDVPPLPHLGERRDGVARL
jgi:hypothetical protein